MHFHVQSRFVGVAITAAVSVFSGTALAQTIDAPRLQELERRASELQPKMVAWRRDIHQHPELSGQEVRTAKLVADHLRALGLEVRTGVGGHGVVGLLKGALPGKVVALRADMDALPIKEDTGLPFASKVIARNFGKDSPVMHACGHDGHTAILMGVAEMLVGMRDRLPGTVKFIFQPSEEGRSEEPSDPNASWGAKAMIADGALENPKVDAIFALHIGTATPVGGVGYRVGAMMAGSDGFRIKVSGTPMHAAKPWKGVDPIVASAQIVTGLQTIVSRQLDLTNQPAVLSIGAINGGNRGNVIPGSVEMLGTLRTYDNGMRAEAKKRIAATAEAIASASGAKADVIFDSVGYPPTVNPPALSETSVRVLNAATGGKALMIPLVSAAEDFAEFQAVVPGFYFSLGAPEKGKTPANAPPNHSPTFDFDEDAMPVGAKVLAALVIDHQLRGEQ